MCEKHGIDNHQHCEAQYTDRKVVEGFKLGTSNFTVRKTGNNINLTTLGTLDTLSHGITAC